jgi:hypothetical protein
LEKFFSDALNFISFYNSGKLRLFSEVNERSNPPKFFP